MDDAALRQLAEQLAGDQAADERKLAELDKMDEVVRLAMEKTQGVSALGTHAVQTMAVLRAAHRMKSAAVREFLRSVDVQRRSS